MPMSGVDGSALTSEAMKTLAKLRADEAARAQVTTAKAPKESDQMGKDTFLKLLVAQLKYQNPLEPTDPSAFMTQTAQFSMVERLTSMEEATSALLTAERSRAATGLLGNQITWKDGDATKSGVVTGVRMGADGPTLEVGDKDVPYGAVTKVTAAPAPPVAPPASTEDDAATETTPTGEA